MKQPDDYLQRIQERYPDLAVNSVVFLEKHGQNNDVLVINDDLVFRFPCTSREIENANIEKAILNRIQAGVPLPVPRPIFTSLGATKPGDVFIGYQYIPGLPLSVEKMATIDDLHQRRALAKQLGGFLHALHDFPAAYLGIELPLNESLDNWKALYADISQRLLPALPPEAQKKITQAFTAVFDHPERLAFEPRLRHGDFGPTNILFDDATGRISGIVDFSCAGVGDPALDLASLLAYGKEFVDLVISAYPEAQSMMDRALFYQSTFAFQDALYGAKERKTPAFHGEV